MGQKMHLSEWIITTAIWSGCTTVIVHCRFCKKEFCNYFGSKEKGSGKKETEVRFGRLNLSI